MNKGLFYLLLGLASSLPASENSQPTQQVFDSNLCNTIAIGKTNKVPVYESNSSNSKVVDYLDVGESVQTGNVLDDFIEVESGSVIGWVEVNSLVYGDDVFTKAESLGVDSYLISKYNSSKIYSEPDLLSPKLDNTLKYKEYSDFSKQGNFYKIKVDDTYGFVRTDDMLLEYNFKSMTDKDDIEMDTEDCIYYLNNDSSYITADWSSNQNLMEPESRINYDGESDIQLNLDDDTAPEVIKNLISKALTFVGNKYVWGGNSLEYGVDCSGFVQQLFRLYGYNLPRTSRSQSKVGIEIQSSDIKAGDLIFYSKNGTVNHVALYIGDGLIVHASNSAPYPKGGIKISKAFYRTPATIRRIIK